MVWRYVWLVPVMAVFSAALSFFIPFAFYTSQLKESYLFHQSFYGIAISQNHTDAWLPYISDGGARKPESCIFGELLNITAFLTAIAFYIRHKQIVEFYRQELGSNQIGTIRTVSYCLYSLGLVVVLGMTLVANFQESQVAIVHNIGALMTFLVGIVYVWAQSVLPAIVRPRMSSHIMTAIRILLCTLSTGFLAMYLVCTYGQPFVKEGPDGVKPKPSESPFNIQRYDWTSPFYTNHLWTTGAEWAMVLTYLLALLSLAVELRDFHWHPPALQLISRQHMAQQYDENGMRVSYIPRVTWPDKSRHIHIDYVPNNPYM